MALDKIAREKIAQYEHAVRIDRVRAVIAYTSVTLVAVIFFMVVSGEQFNYLLSYLGLRGMTYESRGLYTDCQRAENRDAAFCRPMREAWQRKSKVDKEWSAITRSRGHFVPFTLHDGAEKK